MYIAQPAILKEYEGKKFACGKIFGYQINSNGSKLEIIPLHLAAFIEE